MASLRKQFRFLTQPELIIAEGYCTICREYRPDQWFRESVLIRIQQSKNRTVRDYCDNHDPDVIRDVKYQPAIAKELTDDERKFICPTWLGALNWDWSNVNIALGLIHNARQTKAAIEAGIIKHPTENEVVNV